jgi:hypothetical protein
MRVRDGAGLEGCAHRPRWQAGAQLVLVLSLAAFVSNTSPIVAGPPGQGPSAPDAEYDRAATDTARLLAGLPPVNAALYDAVTKRPAWRTHREDFDRNWSRLESERFSVMRAWRDHEFKAVADRCDTLFYPFGGPDFVNAQVLFPNCNQYLLFGLEPVGSVPAFAGAADAAVDGVFSQLRESLSDVFVRDYFITREMMTELRTPALNGTLPLLLVFLARLDARIVDIRMESPWASDEPAPVAPPAATAGSGAARLQPPRPNGVTIRFIRPGSSRVQTLAYSRVRMEDAEFSRQTALIGYMDRRAPFITFLKSASYLMHDNGFSRVRSLILSGSSAVLEDDTGVPFRYFEKAAWNITLFGQYSAPVKDFNYGKQPDLEAAYRDTPGVQDLPFSFGYHWRQGTSSVILAVKKESAH